METILSRWGNSLGLRLPKAIARAAGLDAGDSVLIETCEDGIRIRKSNKQPRYSLEALLDQVTDENRHAPVEWGEAQGGELL